MEFVLNQKIAELTKVLFMEDKSLIKNVKFSMAVEAILRSANLLIF